jgi:CRP-like cAMP-binding protein/L-ascorbate metabolism protein UlaG (beta-lactamase superfamily)
VTQPDGARASKCLVVSPPAPESVAVADELVEPLRFGTDRPLFGVTPLGTSHGFDPSGSFTSFVIWIDGQGLLVDPSPDALERLAQLRVAPCDLSYVLLTHVHADHDGGLLQSVLSGRRTTIVSSDVVFRMFLEKARIITGHDLEKEGLVVHVSANPGSPTQLDLAGEPVVIETRWNLHTIPTNGFKITVGGRSFGYSGDTQYDPGLIERLRSRFSLAARLVDDLLHFFWTQDGQPSVDLVYHEAGVPPIHTERRMLEALPEEIRARMCLVHIADRDVPPGASPAKPKLLSTHVLLPATADSRRRILLRTLRLVSYLYDVPSATLERLVALGRERVFAPGDVVVRRGPVDPSDPRHFYVLLDGELTVLNGKRLLTKLGKADTFGEWGISQPRGFRVADVVAVRHSQALELDGEAYRWLVAAHPAIQGRIHRFRILLLALQAARLSAAWMPGDSRAGTSLLTTMSLGELAAIAVFGETQRATHGTRILSEGERADCFHVVLSGHLTVSLGGHLLSDLAEGDVFGEMALLEGGVRTATVEVASAEAELLVLNEHSFRALLAEDPAFSYAIRALALQRGEDNRRLVPEASEGRFAAGRP